jgi:hypothetical protein
VVAGGRKPTGDGWADERRQAFIEDGGVALWRTDLPAVLRRRHGEGRFAVLRRGGSLAARGVAGDRKAFLNEIRLACVACVTGLSALRRPVRAARGGCFS